MSGSAGRCFCLALPIATALLLSSGADARFVRYTSFRDEDDHCGLYPPDVFAKADAGLADCELLSAGETPLWKGLTEPGARQQVRFTFNEGHGRYTRVVDFTELADGTGEVRRETITPVRIRGNWLRIGERHRARVSAGDVRKLNALAAASGVWDFALGTWNDQGDAIVIHCADLDMERVDPTGYRFSTVFISCNRREKLLPLIRFLAGLAGMKPEDLLDNWVPH